MALGKNFYYEIKLMVSGYFYGFIAIALMITGAVAFADRMHFGAAAPSTIMAIMITAGPIFTIILFGNLYASDFEENTFMQSCTLPGGPLRVFGVRMTVTYSLLITVLGLQLLLGHLLLVPLTWQEAGIIIREALPAHAVLGGLTLLASLLSRNILAALAAGFGYLMVELMTFGQWTKSLSLMFAIWPQSAISAEQHAVYMGLFALTIHCAAGLLIWRGKRWLARKT